MKTRLVLIVSLVLLSVQGCQTDSRQNAEQQNEQSNTEQETPVKLIEYLIGEWEISSPSGEGTSGDQQQGPGQRLTFTSEARYIAYEGNRKVDSGAYRMNEQLHNIYLESERNETPREFEIEINNGTMTLRPRLPEPGQEADSVAAYVYRRTTPASVPPDKSDAAQGSGQ